VDLFNRRSQRFRVCVRTVPSLRCRRHSYDTDTYGTRIFFRPYPSTPLRCVLGYHDSAPSALWISSFILHCPKERVSSYTDSLLLQDFPDLLHVIEIVTGNLQRQVADAHLPTLGVHTVALPLLRGKLCEHAQIGFAQQAKELQ